MLLLIDAGNTRIKWAVVTAAARCGDWQALDVVKHIDADLLAETWCTQGVSSALVSNVAGAAVRATLASLLEQAGVAPERVEWFASCAEMAGLHNTYRNPAQLGCDRFASAIGARALFPERPLIVATCGTATTVDAVSADGHFLGGMILPGLGLMATALARNTAQLPQIGETVAVPSVFADNTDAAIVSGCIAAQCGAIERAVAAHPARQPSNPQSRNDVECIVSGGAGPMIAPHLSIPYQMVDHLVLVGLHAIVLHRKSS